MVEEMNNAAWVGIMVAIVVGGAILIFFWALFPIRPARARRALGRTA
jgi:hypothetical protein